MSSTRAAGLGRQGWVGGGALFAAYVGSAAFASEFAVTPLAGLSVWYPPPGLLLVALHRRGLAMWPVAMVAEAVVALWVYDVGDEFGTARLLVNSVAVTGAYVVGCLVLRSGRFDATFARRRDLATFVVAAFLVAAPLSALAGTAVQRWAGVDEQSWARDWTAWWVGDAIGVLVIAPVALLLPGFDVRPWARQVRASADPVAVGQLVAVVGMPIALFALADDPYRYLYVLVLPIVLVATRRGAGPAALAVLAGVVSTTVAASRHEGGTIGRFELQLLLLVLAVTGHALGVVERLRRTTFSRHVELEALADATADVVVVVDADGTIEWANPAARRLLGDLARLPPELDDGAVAAALERGSFRGSARVVGPDGVEVRLSQQLVALPTAGAPGRVGIIARDVSDLHRVADQLTRAVFVDELTGLANRARLGERLGYALATSDGSARRHGVALIDVDRFTALNDRLGRGAGDRVLRVVADRLLASVRGGELLVRVADDCFGVLLEDIPDTFTAVQVAERLRTAAGGPLDSSLGQAEVSASAGVVVAEAGDDVEVVLRRADLALQRAKHSGGSTTTPFDPAMAEQLERRTTIEADLRRALAGEGWPLRYQPLVDLATGRVVACEALLEPIHPPLEVVSVAEELGLIGELGRQVLAAAVGQAVRWRDRVPELRMSVNVSAQQLLDPGFPEQVDRVVRGAALPARALVLEITETVFADDRIEAAIAAAMLQGMGMKIAVDDFGTGFSSLGRLRSLPVDELKIDRTFVADLGRQPGAEAIVAAVVALGAARGLTVVAEGIEEVEQRDALQAAGCRFGQGWLFARPMGPDAFDAWLDEHLTVEAQPGR